MQPKVHYKVSWVKCVHEWQADISSFCSLSLGTRLLFTPGCRSLGWRSIVKPIPVGVPLCRLYDQDLKTSLCNSFEQTRCISDSQTLWTYQVAKVPLANLYKLTVVISCVSWYLYQYHGISVIKSVSWYLNIIIQTHYHGCITCVLFQWFIDGLYYSWPSLIWLQLDQTKTREVK